MVTKSIINWLQTPDTRPRKRLGVDRGLIIFQAGILIIMKNFKIWLDLKNMLKRQYASLCILG